MAARFPKKTFMQPVLDKNLGANRDNIDKEIVKGHGPKFAPNGAKTRCPPKIGEHPGLPAQPEKVGISGRSPGTTPKK